jgi:hypothetical protein
MYSINQYGAEVFCFELTRLIALEDFNRRESFKTNIFNGIQNRFYKIKANESGKK